MRVLTDLDALSVVNQCGRRGSSRIQPGLLRLLVYTLLDHVVRFRRIDVIDRVLRQHNPYLVFVIAGSFLMAIIGFWLHKRLRNWSSGKRL